MGGPGTRHRRLAAIAAACSAWAIPALSGATPTVTLSSDGGGNYDLVNNGAIQFKLYTSGTDGGKITSIIYDGQQMVGSKDIYYDIQGSPNIYLGSGETYTYRTGSNYAILSAEHPATSTEPLDVTWNWIFEDGQSGFSTYLTYNHTTAMADYASSENRLGAEFFNSSLFHYSSITDNFWGYQDAGDPSRAQGTFVTAETANVTGIPGEYIKNYETKYDWRSTYQQSGGVTGIFGAPNDTTSTKPLLANDYGIWTIENPRTWESWNAGPTHPQTPVADGASIIPSPPGSHFGGPGLTYTGNMTKAFGPIFTYFNKGSNITSLRSDADSYTTTDPTNPKDLNTFYDTLNLPYYATSAQRGTVTGDARIADGQSMTGATIILSTFDPVAYSSSPISQEYQRRAAGYDYWVLANNDGTFSIPDVRPGTYRVTIIKPGNYREGTFDNITVNAGGTTNVGNLTWKPDISGQGVFQIGTFDRTAGEFRDGANYNNWIDTFNLNKEFPNGVNYTVNPANPFNDTANWSQNWPLDQINGQLDFYNVNFNLATAPAANSTVTVTLAIAAQEYINDFAVLVGSNRVDAGFNHTADYAPSVVRSGDTTSAVLYRKLSFPGSWLHSGTNTVTFHIIGGDMQYDAVRMDIQTVGTFSQSQWNSSSGNWSDGTQWMTQQNGYTGVNKGAATINGVANPEYGNDTSTTFADGATATAPINNAGAALYYDATINGGTVNLDTSPQVQKLSLLSGTVNAVTSQTITANDAFVLAGGTFNGSGTINALTTTSVNFASTISGGAKINSIGAVTWTDGGTSVTVAGAGSQWNTPGLSFGQTNTSTLAISSGGLVSTGTGQLTVGSYGTVSASSATITTAGINNAGTFNSSGTVAVGSGSFVNSGTATLSGALTGATVVNNADTLILSGTNSYTGTTTVNGGLLQAAGMSSLGGSGASVTVNGGGAISYLPGITTSTFLARLSTASTGALALTSTDSATALNFTTAPLSSFAGMGIGAAGNVTYSGIYTPAGSIYRLGGGGGTLTYSPAIAGSSSVIIGNNGSSGTVILSTANSYNGTTTIKTGVLSITSLANGGAASPIGSSSNVAANLIIDGGTLLATANSATDRLFTIGPDGATLNGSGGSLSFTNTGSLVGSGTGNRTLTLAGSNLANSLSPAIVDPATGVTGLTMNGTGTWTINSGANNYSGDTTVLAGTLALGPGAVLPSGTGKGNLVVALGATLQLSGQNASVNALNDGPAPASGPASPNGNGGGSINNSSGTKTLTIGSGNAGGQFSGIISGGISLVKNGNGTQILSGDNTYTGTTTINAGAIQIGVGGTPSSFGPGDGGFRGQFGSGTIIDNATVVFNRGYLTTCTNTITGTGMLKQTANAELVLGGANSYSGPTYIGQGIANSGLGVPNDGTGLAYSGDCSLNASVLANGGVASSIGSSSNAASNLILDGGTLYYTGGTASTDRQFTVTQNGGAIYASGGITFSNANPIVFSGTGNRTFSLEGDTTTTCTFDGKIGDPISGITSLTKDRSGTWVLGTTATLTYSGDTDIDMGVLKFTVTNQLPYGVGKGNVVFATATDFGSIYDPVLELNGFDQNINGLSGGLTGYGSVDNNAGTHTLTLGNNNATAEFAGILTGGLNLIKTGSGTQTLDGVNTNTGSTTVNAGALIFSATSAVGGTGKNVFINNGATLGAPGTNLNQSFASRIATSSSGVLALTSSDANNLDFSSAGANLVNVSLGAIGSDIFSGTITPYGTSYELGGGGGTLTVTTALTGAANSLVVGEAGNNNGAVGTVILTNTDTYGGATTVMAGVLQFNASSGIGGTGASVTVNSGAVAATGYAMDQPFLGRINNASTGVVALAAASSNNLDLSTGTGAGLTKVSIGAIGAISFGGVITPANNAYVFGGGGGTLSITNSIALAGTASVTVGLGNVSPASIPNPLTLAVTAAQSYTGVTTIKTGGIITGTIANGLSPSALGASSNVAANLVFDGGTLVPTGGTDRLFTLTNNGGTIDNSAGTGFNSTGAIALPSSGSTVLTLTGTNTGHETFSPALANPAGGTTSVVKSGSGKWTFNTTNTKSYSGDTHVTAGTLETLLGNALSPNSNMVLDSGAILDFHDNSPETVNALQGAGAVANSFSGSHTDSFTIGANNGSGAFSGTIGSAGTFNFTKAGSGTQVLSGAASFTGTTAVTGGVLTIDYPGSFTGVPYTVTAGATLNVDGTIPSNATIADSGNTTFGASQGTGIFNRSISSLMLTTGSLAVVQAPSALGNRTVLVTSSLAFGGGTNAWLGKVDLSSNDLVVHNASLATLTNQIKQGYNGGTWSGSAGIISSAAAADTTHLTTLGTIIGGGSFDNLVTSTTDVLVKYTYYGDATMDGKIDGSDYSRIDSGYLTHATGWNNGDFNYDGVINGSDYTLIDNAFNTQGAAISATIGDPTAEVTDQIAPAASVPEPGMCGLLGLSAMVELSRRRCRWRELLRT
jgi:autotransporter-associated beta strand protein